MRYGKGERDYFLKIIMAEINNLNITSLDELKDKYYGAVGTAKRDQLERELETLRVGMKIREARLKRNLTQAQLASLVNKKRAFISKVENDGSNLTLKTLYEIVENGLGGRLSIDVQL